jgi:hypothetical protein
MDPNRIYVVERRLRPSNQAAGALLVIEPDDSLPAGRYRRAGNVVSVAPAAIQSFAAGFIADHLERTSPTDGSSSSR